MQTQTEFDRFPIKQQSLKYDIIIDPIVNLTIYLAQLMKIMR